MLDLLSSLYLGLSVAVTPQNLMYCFIGAMLGTLIGVLPGIGPVPTMAVLLPITFGLSPVGALIMLAGIYYGAQYGGSTTAILVNLPGEASSVITCLDGYALARKGRAGSALAIAAIGSFVAGTLATILIALFAPGLGTFAAGFTPADYVSLMVLGLVGAVVLSHGSIISALAMVLVGILLGLVGTDINTGSSRLTFGYTSLADGIDFAPLAVGLFGLAEILSNLESPQQQRQLVGKVSSVWPRISELRISLMAILRGTAIGSALGVLPGGGASLAAFVAYSLEKRVSRHPEEFGQGALEGVAAPESANNAAAQTSFVPMLTLGIPTNAIMALMIGAMTIQGVTPGPQVMTQQPELFWGLIASMWVGNAMLLVINLPLIRIWIVLLSIPYRLLFPAIVLFCCIGVYSIGNSVLDVFLAAGFGLFGYLIRKFRCEPVPLILGFVLGPQLEENFRRSLTMSRGSFAVYVQEPLSLVLLLLTLALLAVVAFPQFARRRQQAFEAEE